MATLRITLSNPNFDKATYDRDFHLTSRHQELVKLANHLAQLNSGLAHGSGSTLKVETLDDQTQATGTVTFASSTAGDTVTLGNVTFTAVSGTPSGNQFKVGVSNTADAASLASAINANTSLNKYVSAVAASGVVTLTGLSLGALGNLLQLSSSNNTRLAVVAFASGVDDTVTSYSL